jgi:hypothetical protein
MGAYRPSEDQDGLANYLAKRPHLRDWDRPTAWLLGTQMISSLRQLILSTIHTGFDLRDWMTAEATGDDNGVVIDGGYAGTEYWFDFVADTGDAPALVYSLSRAMQHPELEVSVGKGKTTKLPRGRLLVLGGDSAYPVADQVAIRERWQAPHVWAARANRDLYKKEHGVDPPPLETIPVYAIPGNHDYYDALDGFNRQFRKQATDDDKPSKKYGTPPPLRLPSYSRTQLASYFALRLPFQWQLWGVDLGIHPDEPRPIDTRQQEYFNKLGVPEKLIVVTALPVAVHHAYATNLVSPFEQLGLPIAFDKNGALDARYTRLDLSGDVHLYERYWGTTVTPADEQLQGDTRTKAHARANYAAVTSGLGGAFHHPLQVRCDQEAEHHATPQHSWPPETESRKRIGDVLTRPRKVFQAGSIGIVGAALGLLFYLLSNTSWGDGPGVLALPELLWARSWCEAGTTAKQFGLVAAFGAVVVAWGFLMKPLRKATRKVHDAMLEPFPDQDDAWGKRLDRARAWLDRRFMGQDPGSYRARFLRWTGANRRVMTSVILRLPIWIAVLATLAGVAVAGYFLLRHSRDAGTNIAALFLVGGLVAFPFITNDRRGKRWHVFIGLGLIHGIAQLYSPQLWAGATVALVVPMLMLAGYWCVRPLPNLLFTRGHHSRWLTPIWFVLVAVVLVGPMALLRIRLTEWNGAYTIGITVWLALCLAGVLAARAWVSEETTWDNWRWGVLAAMLVVQVGTLLALPYARDLTSERTDWWLGLAAAVVGGAFFACLWLGWYVAVCLQWSWHGNDAGSVARVDDFAEFLRVRLTESEAEVWAIAVDANFRKTHPLDGDTFAGAAHLIDHFKVTASVSEKGPR